MKVIFDTENKRLTITECEFDFVEVVKDGISIADIPIKDGDGCFTNTDDIQLNDTIILYPYNVIGIFNVVEGINLDA